MAELGEGFVYYCKDCHSLCIIVDDSLASEVWDGSYCGKCHSTNIGVCTMEVWLDVEKKREQRRKEIEWNK